MNLSDLRRAAAFCAITLVALNAAAKSASKRFLSTGRKDRASTQRSTSGSGPMVVEFNGLCAEDVVITADDGSIACPATTAVLSMMTLHADDAQAVQSATINIPRGSLKPIR